MGRAARKALRSQAEKRQMTAERRWAAGVVDSAVLRVSATTSAAAPAGKPKIPDEIDTRPSTCQQH